MDVPNNCGTSRDAPRCAAGNHDQVNNPAPIQLTVELTGTAGYIQGTVRYSDRPAIPFSGWSELFAALLAAVADAGQTHH
jgi:hypothetical protein